MHHTRASGARMFDQGALASLQPPIGHVCAPSQDSSSSSSRRGSGGRRTQDPLPTTLPITYRAIDGEWLVKSIQGESLLDREEEIAVTRMLATATSSRNATKLG